MSIENYTKEILKALGENPGREGLQKTPQRFARALEHLTQGYHQDIDKILNNAIFTSDINEMIIVKNIELFSLCEHHLLPFIGKCHVGYLPNGKVLGLSKIARIVDMFAKRLQIQENLTQQIANAILSATDARGVGVIIESKHLCMMMRGVEKQQADMTTSVMLKAMREDSRTRQEFLQLIRSQ